MGDMEKLPTYRHPRRLLAAGLVAGLLANSWFVEGPLGIGFFLFASGFVVALRLLGGREGWQRAGAAKLFLIPMLLCAGFVAIRDAKSLTCLNVVTATGLACLTARLFAGEQKLWRLKMGGYLKETLAGAASAFTAAPIVLSQSVDAGQAVESARKFGWPVVRAAAFAVPVLIVFGGLLASADPIFSKVVTSNLAALFSADLASFLSSALVVAGVGLLCTGLWAIANRRADTREVWPVPPSRQPRWVVESFGIVGSLLLLFGAFSVIQAACLFGHVALPAHLTWADYARQGFFQLLWVAGLALVLISALNRGAAFPAHLKNPFSVMCTGLIALTLLILASAVKRITLYEEAYGFTEDRLYSHVFAFALAAMLAWRAVTLWSLPQTFATGSVASLIGFVLALNVLNPDAFIAERNLQRDDVDRHHLSTLSADAAPAIAAMAAAPAFRSVLELRSRNAQGRLSGGWASFNCARWAALSRTP